MTIVDINALQVRFVDKVAVKNATLSVQAGETFSLIGESGCGKSTILRVLAGLQREWQGDVSLLGSAIVPGARFQGVSVSVSLLPGRCCCARSSCCLMSPPRRWICRYRLKSLTC